MDKDVKCVMHLLYVVFSLGTPALLSWALNERTSRQKNLGITLCVNPSLSCLSKNLIVVLSHLFHCLSLYMWSGTGTLSVFCDSAMFENVKINKDKWKKPKIIEIWCWNSIAWKFAQNLLANQEIARKSKMISNVDQGRVLCTLAISIFKLLVEFCWNNFLQVKSVQFFRNRASGKFMLRNVRGDWMTFLLY